MNTGIGRIGSQHTLTSSQDDTLYLFNGVMWCTHPLLGYAWNSNGFNITAGSKIMTAGAGSEFSLLCLDITKDNVPYNKYIAYYNGSTAYGILEVDYVLDDATLILKYPAVETATIDAPNASQINYWGTPVLKEVECRNQLNAGTTPVTLIYANKYAQNSNAIWDIPWTYGNEGGVEPMLITSTDILTVLKY